ncbi:MAG: hypothetical protein HMLIMOIP_001483 [Candidatus Nitrosomirales archaeon]|jgi:hypothetical protein
MMKVIANVICILSLLSNVGLHYHASAEMQGERPESPIEATTDKSDYFNGETVMIRGTVPTLENGHEVNVIVKDANGGTFTKLRVKPTTESKFEVSFQIPSYDKLFPTGKWTINIGYAIWAAKLEINVLVGEKKFEYPITISDPLFISHTSLMYVTVGDEVFIATEAKNNTPVAKSFVYLVLVRDGFGSTVLLDWVEASLPANETRQVSMLWIPEQEGKYEAEVFFWSDLNKPVPLSASWKGSQVIII